MNENITIKELPVSNFGSIIYGKAFIPQIQCGKLPAVILSHGYNSSHRDVMDMAAALAKLGVFAYCFDFCGGSCVSKSSGSSVDMSIQTEIRDLKAVSDMVKSLEFIDGKKLCLYGESQGGFVSALTAAENPDDFAGLFLLYPAFCIPDDWKKLADERDIDTVELMGMTLSRKFYDELPQYDVFDHIKRYSGNVLIAHGTADTVVPIEYSERLTESFPSARLVTYQNEGHGFKSEARRQWIDMVCNEFKNSFK
ncbi:MAG: alpha/beta fold hydrolase [Ruminococcus sp.]|nr:alpha/beta fold hydrolase [Ruminococcus sp.]